MQWLGESRRWDLGPCDLIVDHGDVARVAAVTRFIDLEARACL
jgi:hypothetical protein